jgi:hypothetical protein
MISELDMTILAGIVNAAASHLDCDDVYRLVVVGTTGMRINIDSTNVDPTNFWNILGHVGEAYVQLMVSSSS